MKHIKYVFYRNICDVFSGSGTKLLVGVEFLSFLRHPSERLFNETNKWPAMFFC